MAGVAPIDLVGAENAVSRLSWAFTKLLAPGKRSRPRDLQFVTIVMGTVAAVIYLVRPPVRQPATISS
jgi:hypothetical protein